MSDRDDREIFAQNPLRRRRSSMSEPPMMNDVIIIVLLGKSVEENSRVGNFILGRAVFDSEAPPDVVERIKGRLKDRYVMIINSPQLLQTNLSDLQITQTVGECVSLSAPGPHVIVLLLNHEQCSTEDHVRVEKLRDSFSEQLFQHTMVLSTQQSTETNDILQKIIQKSSNRHFSLQRNSSPDDLLQVFDDIVKMNGGHRLDCAQYEASEVFTTEQEDTERRSAEREDELRIVLLGKTGVGKSATGNTILGRDAFKAELSQELVTKECQRETCEINGRNVTVIDTPGLFDTELSNEEIQREISNCISMILPGPHVFIIVLNLGHRFTQEEEKSVKIIQEMFGENCLMFSMVLFTRGDDLNKSIEECFGKPGSPLIKMIEACANRYHVFNNNQPRDRAQVTDLLEKIDHMLKENGGSFYSCKMFSQMEREKQEQQIEIFIERVREKEEEIKKLKERMKMMEEERETFRHAIAEMGQEKEKIKTEKEKLQITHNTEIEKIKLEEKTRREEEDEKRKEKEQRDLDEFNERLKQEKDHLQFKHEEEENKMKTEMEKLNTEKEELMKKLEEEKERRKMTMEEERMNYDEERKRREDLREREEWFKRETKTQEEKERETLEMMKREQGKIFEEQIQIQRLKSDMEEIIREKERIEKEKQKQVEDLQKRLKEERNMRENQLKLIKEQYKDELKRKQNEWREEYKREKEEKICSETGDSLQGLNEKIQHLFDRLHLDKHHNKLTPADVPQINERLLESHESCDEEELIQTFLQKLLMTNYRERNPSEHDQTQQRDHDSSENDGTSQSEPIHPMDLQMAVFHHADAFLKQLMVTKLSQCQYALPLLVPDPFTRQIEFPLWTFRQINKSWKMRNTNNEIISHTQPIYKAQTPMVFFFRSGSVSSSKSQLMNSLINGKHDRFFHRHCSGSSRTRVLMDGVVEVTWFFPSGTKDDQFTECVAFCNLHGDAGEHEKQLKILTEMASVNVVLLPQLDRTKLSKDLNTELEKLSTKPLIYLFPTDVSALTETREGRYKIGLKGRSQSDVSEELRGVINDYLSSYSTFSLEDVSKHFRVDEEDDDDCKRGRAAAQQMMSLLENKDVREIKESFLPHQGKLWRQWSQKNRKLHQPQADGTEVDLSRKRTEMEKIREQQHESDTSEFMKLFIEEMNLNDENKMFFLKWLRIFLDQYTTEDLAALHHKYDKKRSTVLKLKEIRDEYEQLKAEQTELETISEDLQAASFGLEHIMREIGQIYESCSSVNKSKKDLLMLHYSSLPSLAAEMMISGFPLELMDGDAAHVPVIWISAVLDELVQKLGDQRVFVLSVLGLQSSGKSTMLNAMFGLQFDVSAGRCTRGAFMQLVKVSDDMKTEMNFDYILVVDNEGLRTLELSGRSTRDHDNELATFVVGLANLTLINIFGENPSEMQDIVQIAVQAFVRMKKVRLNPSCVFVHQNISDVTAGERNEEERRRLQEKLDEMTKHAAEHFAHLWEGNPPTAPPTLKYCENIQELKTTIMSHAAESHEIMLDIKNCVTDLWETLLKEPFVETN